MKSSEYILIGTILFLFILVMGLLKERKHLRRTQAKPIQVSPEMKALFVTDATKRKSLQPSNQPPMALGWTDAHDQVATQTKARVSAPTTTAPLEDHFEHKFYGTQLMVGDRVVVNGLNKGLHHLEITKDGQMIIDNHVVPFNSGDLERIKAAIRG